MTCARPIAFEDLVALWSGDLSDERRDALEEHLFSCDACTVASDRLGRVVGGLRQQVPPVVSHALRDRLAAAGMRLVHTRVEPGVQATAVFAPDVDLLVHVLHGDLSRAERVDMEVVTLDGVTRLTYEHVPFDADAGEVLIACQRHYQFVFPQQGDPTFRIHAVEGGARRLVGDYVVHHVWIDPET